MAPLFVAAFICSQAHGSSTTFEFSGTDEDGTGSAEVTIDIVGNTLTWTMDNTSPATLDSSSGDNAPGIVGIGFDLAPDRTVVSWSLTAYTDSGQTTTAIIGGESPVGTPIGGINDWELGTFIAGVTLDFLPKSVAGGVKGAIYNPLAPSGGLAATPNYFSTVMLVMDFNAAPVLDSSSSPFIRMQNVGRRGDGSLKLFGTPTTTRTGSAVPEPSTLALLGIGSVCVAVVGVRRRRKNKAA